VTASEHARQGVRWGLWLRRLPSLVAGAALLVLMLMTFTDVVLRSVFDSPLSIAAELTDIFMAVIVFAALPVITWRGQHIVVDLLDPITTGIVERIRDIAINLVCGLALLWPAWRTGELAARAKSYGDVTEYLHIPQFYIQYFIAVMAGLTALAFIARGLLYAFAPRRLPERAGTRPTVD